MRNDIRQKSAANSTNSPLLEEAFDELKKALDELERASVLLRKQNARIASLTQRLKPIDQFFTENPIPMGLGGNFASALPMDEVDDAEPVRIFTGLVDGGRFEVETFKSDRCGDGFFLDAIPVGPMEFGLVVGYLAAWETTSKAAVIAVKHAFRALYWSCYLPGLALEQFNDLVTSVAVKVRVAFSVAKFDSLKMNVSFTTAGAASHLFLASSDSAERIDDCGAIIGAECRSRYATRLKSLEDNDLALLLVLAEPDSSTKWRAEVVDSLQYSKTESLSDARESVDSVLHRCLSENSYAGILVKASSGRKVENTDGATNSENFTTQRRDL